MDKVTFEPRLQTRAALVGGAYVVAACVVGIWDAFISSPLPSPLLNPLKWPMGLWIFPAGLTLLFKLPAFAWYTTYAMFASYATYAVLAAQIFVPSKRWFFVLYALLIATLCLNVAGCVGGGLVVV